MAEKKNQVAETVATDAVEKPKKAAAKKADGAAAAEKAPAKKTATKKADDTVAAEKAPAKKAAAKKADDTAVAAEKAPAKKAAAKKADDTAATAEKAPTKKAAAKKADDTVVAEKAPAKKAASKKADDTVVAAEKAPAKKAAAKKADDAAVASEKPAAKKATEKKETAPVAKAEVKAEPKKATEKKPAAKAPAAKKEKGQVKSSKKEESTRLKNKYTNEVVDKLIKQFGYKNINEVPQVSKIVLNMGLGDVKDNAKSLQNAVEELRKIAGQKPITTKSKKSIANFKLREGMSIGAKVTLRGRRMYEFMDKFISIALPRVRDFRGIPSKSFDGRGNYAMGVKEQLIFPEISYDQVEKVRGFDVCFVTSAKSDEEAKALLTYLGMPFQN